MSRSRLMVTNFIGIIVILALLIGGGYYYVQKSNYITTDNAKVFGDVYNVVAPAAGKVASWTVEEGNDVDVTVDGDSSAKIDGKVEEIGYATNSLSSLTSNSSSDGNYTKVSQTVPVKISISNYSEHVLPGMNAEVKISKD